MLVLQCKLHMIIFFPMWLTQVLQKINFYAHDNIFPMWLTQVLQKINFYAHDNIFPMWLT